MFRRLFDKGFKRVIAAAMSIALIATIVVTQYVPSHDVRINIGGLLALDAKVGLTVAQAVGSHDLGYHSGFELGAFTDWEGITGSPSIETAIYGDIQDIATSGVRSYYDDRWWCQTFTTESTAHLISGVELWIGQSNNPVEDLVVDLHAVDGSSKPTGAVLATATVAEADLPNLTPAYAPFVFTTPYAASASTEYAYVIHTASTGDGTGQFHYTYTEGGSLYAGGGEGYSADGGGTWGAISTTTDMKFKVILDVAKTGDYMMMANPSSSTEYASQGVDTTQKFSAQLYIKSLPTADAPIFGTQQDTTLYLTTTGELDIHSYDGGSLTKEADGTTQLELYNWYNIQGTINDSDSKVYVWIDSIIEHNGITVGTSDDGWGNSSYKFGVGVFLTSTTADLYFDDIAFSTTTGSATALGDIRVVRAMPDADEGTYNEFDSVTGYANVNEFPFSSTAYVEDDGGDIAWELFSFEAAADLGIGASDLIAAVYIWGTFDKDGGGSTRHALAWQEDGTRGNSGTAYDTLDNYDWGGRIHPDTPIGDLDWTQARYDAMYFGFSHTGGQDQRNGSITVMVAYEVIGAAAADISNTPTSKAFSVVDTSTTYWSDGAEPSWPLVDADAFFTLTNNGATCSVTVVSTNFTGGVGWTLTSGAPGTNTVRLTVFEEGDGSGAGLILTTSPQAFISALSTNVDWELKIETPSSMTDGTLKTATITLAATLD